MTSLDRWKKENIFAVETCQADFLSFESLYGDKRQSNIPFIRRQMRQAFFICGQYFILPSGRLTLVSLLEAAMKEYLSAAMKDVTIKKS